LKFEKGGIKGLFFAEFRRCWIGGGCGGGVGPG